MVSSSSSILSAVMRGASVLLSFLQRRSSSQRRCRFLVLRHGERQNREVRWAGRTVKYGGGRVLGTRNRRVLSLPGWLNLSDVLDMDVNLTVDWTTGRLKQKKNKNRDDEAGEEETGVVFEHRVSLQEGEEEVDGGGPGEVRMHVLTRSAAPPESVQMPRRLLSAVLKFTLSASDLELDVTAFVNEYLPTFAAAGAAAGGVTPALLAGVLSARGVLPHLHLHTTSSTVRLSIVANDLTEATFERDEEILFQ